MLKVVCMWRAVQAGRAARCKVGLRGCPVAAVRCSALSGPGPGASPLPSPGSLRCEGRTSPGPGPTRGIFAAANLQGGGGGGNPQRDRRHEVALKRDTPTPSTAQKVKEAGRDLTYLAVVVVGIAVTGGLFYVIFKELFSSSSPNKIYGAALEKCRAHPEIIGALGGPIKGYGETTRRGRRRHVSHREYIKNGTKHIQLVFYIEGIEPIKGTVHLDAKENPESGRYDFCYIFVDFDTYPKRTIIVEDNR